MSVLYVWLQHHAEQLWGVWTFNVSFTSSWKYFMDDPAAKSVKLIPCYTLTAAMKGIFHTMYDRRQRGIRQCSCLSIIQYFPWAFQYAIDINQTSCDHICALCVYATCLLSHCLSWSACILLKMRRKHFEDEVCKN